MSTPETPDHAEQAEVRLRLVVKKELRKRMRGLRATVPATSLAARSAEIVRRVTELPRWSTAAGIALFFPMSGRSEVDLRALATIARESGKRVAYPFVDTETGAMRLRFVDDEESLIDGPLGAKEPPEDAQISENGQIDLVLVPALAVDERGHRIGYGGGFYDRLLPVYAPPALAVVVAFDFQLLSEVPATEGDVAVAHIVTDVRSFAAGASQPHDALETATVAGAPGVRTVARRTRKEP